MLFCKNCKPECSDVEGDFSCLGLPSKTTLESILERVKELYCEECGPPKISVDGNCSDNNLNVVVEDLGKAEKITVELYKDTELFKSLRVDQTGNVVFNVPYGDYRIRAYNTYNFDCSTSFINYRHQCVNQECIHPIISVVTSSNPPTVYINLISMGETHTVEIKVYRDNKIVNSYTTNETKSYTIPAVAGVYTVAVVSQCGENYVSDEYKVVIKPNNCDVAITGLNYDCDTGKLDVAVSGGSLAYEYSLDQVSWYSSIENFNFNSSSFHNLFVRDKNNTTCINQNQFSTVCDCQLSFEYSELQCNVTDCQLSFTYTDLQCSNTLICGINGSINLVQ